LVAGAGTREADDGAGREAIVQPSRTPRRARGKIVAADDGRVAGGAVRAAIARPPHAPALVETDRLRRRLEDLGVGERDIVGHLFALRRKAERRAAGTGEAAAAIDERIEHDAEELVPELKRDLLAAGRSFAREERQRVGEIAAGQPEDIHEGGRQPVGPFGCPSVAVRLRIALVAV
jgi:hypothetical protein